MFNFTAEKKESVKVPFFESANKEDGWQGHTTTKSLKTLQSEIGAAIGRLGGTVSVFQRGTYLIDSLTREGFQIHYSIQNPNGQIILGRLDIAALPVKNRGSLKHQDERREKSIRMSLYMLKMALDGMWFMQQLSPGYAALMPWMLADKNKTVSQLWSESPIMSHLLPPGDSEFVDAEEV